MSVSEASACCSLTCQSIGSRDRRGTSTMHWCAASEPSASYQQRPIDFEVASDESGS